MQHSEEQLAMVYCPRPTKGVPCSSPRSRRLPSSGAFPVSQVLFALLTCRSREPPVPALLSTENTDLVPWLDSSHLTLSLVAPTRSRFAEPGAFR